MLDDPISRIEAALEAGPTPGVWEYREVDGIGSVAAPKGWVGAVVADRGHECIDANYIAACNPVAIRALLDRLKAAEAENERLRRWEGAAREWLDKTEWVQERIDSGHMPAKYLGKHRADIMRAEVDRLRATLARLACLGNGDRYGNSEGNMIARAALENTDAR